MSDPNIFKSGDYEYRLTDIGVQFRKVGEQWKYQQLLFANVRILLTTKNEIFKKHGDNLAKANELWQREIIRQLRANLPKKRSA